MSETIHSLSDYSALIPNMGLALSEMQEALNASNNKQLQKILDSVNTHPLSEMQEAIKAAQDKQLQALSNLDSISGITAAVNAAGKRFDADYLARIAQLQTSAGAVMAAYANSQALDAAALAAAIQPPLSCMDAVATSLEAARDYLPPESQAPVDAVVADCKDSAKGWSRGELIGIAGLLATILFGILGLLPNAQRSKIIENQETLIELQQQENDAQKLADEKLQEAADNLADAFYVLTEQINPLGQEPDRPVEQHANHSDLPDADSHNEAADPLQHNNQS